MIRFDLEFPTNFLEEQSNCSFIKDSLIMFIDLCILQYTALVILPVK